MVRILDLDSMASGDITSDNFIIIGNTPNTFGVKKIRMVDALNYFTTAQSVNIDAVNSAIDSALGDVQVTARSSLSASGSITYNSSTGVIGYVQPTNVSDFTNDAGYLTDADTLDEAEAIALIDGTYVQARQDYSYASLTGEPTNVSQFSNDAGYLTDANTLDSSEAIALINTAYVQGKQDYSYGSLTGAPSNVSDFSNDAGYLTDADTLNESEAIALIDTAYVQGKQDYSYASLTGEPTNVSQFSNDAGYLTNTDTLDSSEAIVLIEDMIDSAYINSKVTIPDGYDNNDVIALVDSSYVQARIGEVGIDSGSIINLIDSDYVESRVSESLITGITDPRYVALGGDSMTGDLWVDGDIYASGNITGFSSFSDISLKENMRLITNANAKLQELSGYTFNYKSKPEVRVPGVIAQDVEKILPEAVYETADGKKAVLYGNLVALLIEAMKELNYEIDDLRTEMDEMKGNM